MKKWYIYLLIGFIACSEEALEVHIDQELKPYFDRFAKEGNQRGVEIDFTTAEIEGLIQSLTDKNVKGQCIHDNLQPEKVIVDRDFWVGSNDNSREFIVFHELGHCFLKRVHLDEVNNQGICLSIMHSGSHTCRENYSLATRKKYLDELFGL